MSELSSKNIPASIRAKLLNVSRPTGEDFNVTLVRYAVERFLYRLSKSKHRGTFILKGAMLMVVWMAKPHRPTQDLDLLGCGDLSDDKLRLMLKDVINMEVPEDGLVFDNDSITIEDIREGQAYQGKRTKLTCRLGKTRIRLQIDIGLGDIIVPKPKLLDYPTMIDLPAPRIRAYSREAAVSEKLEAMISLGITNSRMKDFYDIWFMSQNFLFDSVILSKAMAATFKRRKTAFPEQPLRVLLQAFVQDGLKQKQWQAFIQRANLVESTPEFVQLIEQLEEFLSLPLEAAMQKKAAGSDSQWALGGPWCTQS